MYLTIPSEKFIACYNDYEFVDHIDLKGKEGNQLEYLKWGAAKYLLSKYFPNLHVDFEQYSDGLPAFKTPNNLIKEEAKNNFYERIATIKASIEEDMVALQKTEYKKQWEVKKEIAKKEKEIANLNNQLFYDNSGYYLKPYLVDVDTGLRTPSLFFPLMDYNNDPIYQADSRDISDNIQRALVKCIAYYTGIGLLIYTRGAGIGKNFVNQSPKWKIIEKILKDSTLLEKEVDKTVVNFGSSEAVLSKISASLEQQLLKTKMLEAIVSYSTILNKEVDTSEINLDTSENVLRDLANSLGQEAKNFVEAKNKR